MATLLWLVAHRHTHTHKHTHTHASVLRETLLTEYACALVWGAMLGGALKWCAMLGGALMASIAAIHV